MILEVFVIRSFLFLLKKKKKCYFYSFTTVAGGGWGGAGKPVSIGGRFGCEFSMPDEFGGEARLGIVKRE